MKNEHAMIKLKTAWTEQPTDELAAIIEAEIKSYLHEPEVLAYLPKQSYTIQFVNEDYVLLEIMNK